MLNLPVDYAGLVTALTRCLCEFEAGMVTTDRDDDPDILCAALDEAALRAGKRVRHAWVGYDRAALAWLNEDDVRLQVAPWLNVVGVRVPAGP